uniref:DUF1618 domain-containing protein n=1 Tax=Aegilops tauschii subsp. strangulata TaxID=200361 RepID=A0A453M724_AEGTS
RAWRSFLRRPDPLISRLRPVRRHDATQTAVLGDLVSSRGLVTDATNGDPHQAAAATTRRHLYLVLDDYKKDRTRKNYGVYKMDVDADLDDGVGSPSASAPRRLPLPAVIRLQIDAGQCVEIAAEGSCIIAKCFFPWMDKHDGTTFVYDMKTATLSIPSGDGRDVLKNPYHDYHIACRRWWCERVSIGPLLVKAHAVHPREATTVFLSGASMAPVPGPCIFDDVNTTLSYDTRTAGWTDWGSSALPFKGHAVYDAELDAWIGFHADEKGEVTGHLVACRVPSCQQDWPPDSQVIGEKMLLDEPGWRHLDASLVHMAESGEHCIVEQLRREGTDQTECLPHGDECLLVVTTFRVGVEHNGIGVTDRRACSYKVSRYDKFFAVRAFWM